MPLLLSPIDGAPMRQIQRFGIELDVCPSSGGVWLDKGELEKLINFLKEAAEEESREISTRNTMREDRHEQPRYREDHHYREDHQNFKGGQKKKGGLHQIMELFEF